LCEDLAKANIPRVQFHALAEEYRGKTDDELVRLAFERAQLTPEANTALDAELTHRRINAEERLRAFHDTEFKCLDDQPSRARIAARQQFYRKWGKVVALAPFVVALFVVQPFFSKSTSWIPDALLAASLVWGIVVVGYYFYLLFAVKCPACGWRFGMGDKCMNCDLPRHRADASATPAPIA
jgi:hypothetical protein